VTQVTPESNIDTDPEELSRRERARIEQEAETNRLRLENLMLREGVDPESGLGKLFANGYQGEVTSDAVKAAIDEAGVRPAPVEAATPGVPTPEITPEERAQTGERGGAASGAVAGETPEPHPFEAGRKEGQRILDAGGTDTAAMAATFDEIAARGFGSKTEGRAPDRRAHFDGTLDPRHGIDLGW
jgi:hypothetical protein